MIKNLHYLNENQWMKGQTHEPQGHFLQFSPLNSILDRNWWPISCHTGRLLSEVWCINNDPLPNLMAPPWPELTSQAKGQNNRWNTDVVCYGRGFCSGAMKRKTRRNSRKENDLVLCGQAPESLGKMRNIRSEERNTAKPYQIIPHYLCGIQEGFDTP